MASKQTPRSKRSYDQEFYETMPSGAYMDTYDFFAPGAQEVPDEAEPPVTTLTQEELRRRMVRQGLVMVGLLAAQIILFALLINYTTNLG